MQGSQGSVLDTLAVPFEKMNGQYFTPSIVAGALVQWTRTSSNDRAFDPSSGDGQFLHYHQNIVGVELDPVAIEHARRRAPHAELVNSEFFHWAGECLDSGERFDAAVGNPPFIRYQRFNGEVRRRALSVVNRVGSKLSGLTSSWAPFVIVSASLLAPGGRLGFVVPAEIGHAPYAAPVISYLLDNFGRVQLIRFRERLFPELSEDTWLLYAEDYGAAAESLELSTEAQFRPTASPPQPETRISRDSLRALSYRVRNAFLPDDVVALYRDLSASDGVHRLGDMANVGIGYVTGANSFFHLTPSTVKAIGIPPEYLQVTVRNGNQLPDSQVTSDDVARWIAEDAPVYLLAIDADAGLTKSVRAYLESPEAHLARRAYKCRTRTPWYSVPDVRVPDAFLTYMIHREPKLVLNNAGCTCTNTLHAVRMKDGCSARDLAIAFHNPLTQLSCEIEGHPLGGGMLKLEPKEAQNVLIPLGRDLRAHETRVIDEATKLVREWRIGV